VTAALDWLKPIIKHNMRALAFHLKFYSGFRSKRES